MFIWVRECAPRIRFSPLASSGLRQRIDIVDIALERAELATANAHIDEADERLLQLTGRLQ